MVISRERKSELIAQYNEWLGRSQALFIAEYKGLTMKQLDDLRNKIRDAGGEFHVVKNTRGKRAFEAAGMPLSAGPLEGSTAVSFAFGDVAAISLRLLDLPFSQLRRFAEPDPIREFSRARVAMGAGAEAPDAETTLQGRIALGLAAHVEAGARVVDAVILPEAWIGPGTRLRRVVVGPGAEVPAGFAMEEAMICADPEDAFPLPPGTERIAGLLVRRFA